MKRKLSENEAVELHFLLEGAYACERERVLNNYLRKHDIVLFRDEIMQIRFKYDMQEMVDEYRSAEE